MISSLPAAAVQVSAVCQLPSSWLQSFLWDWWCWIAAAAEGLSSEVLTKPQESSGWGVLHPLEVTDLEIGQTGGQHFVSQSHSAACVMTLKAVTYMVTNKLGHYIWKFNIYVFMYKYILRTHQGTDVSVALCVSYQAAHSGARCRSSWNAWSADKHWQPSWLQSAWWSGSWTSGWPQMTLAAPGTKMVELLLYCVFWYHLQSRTSTKS